VDGVFGQILCTLVLVARRVAESVGQILDISFEFLNIGSRLGLLFLPGFLRRAGSYVCHAYFSLSFRFAAGADLALETKQEGIAFRDSETIAPKLVAKASTS
jgi:hypothetical protein